MEHMPIIIGFQTVDLWTQIICHSATQNSLSPDHGHKDTVKMQYLIWSTFGINSSISNFIHSHMSLFIAFL